MEEITLMDPTTRTRVKVAYEYDPSKDYWSLIESQCPAWQPEVLAEGNNTSSRRRGTGRAVTWDDEGSGARVVMINVPGKGLTEWVQPFQEYVPAIDPAGNICPLTVVTCRLPEDDGTGFRDKIIAKKKRAGWFIATRDQEFQGLVDQEYAAFLCALIPMRKAAHAERMLEEEKKFFSAAEKLQIQQAAAIEKAVTEGAAANRDVMMDVVKAVGAEFGKALAGNSKPAQEQPRK